MMLPQKMPPNMRVIDETLIYPRYPSGVMDNQDAIVRYRHSNMNEPVLKLVDYIYDYNGNCIYPGIYELALSDDKEWLLLIESHNLIAIIPVFKLAQNDAELQKIRDRLNKKNKKIKSFKQRNKERLEATLKRKFAEDAVTQPDEDYTYMNAEIEYIEEGGYYLILYENGAYRAWGAIKVKNKFGGKSPQLMREKED